MNPSRTSLTLMALAALALSSTLATAQENKGVLVVGGTGQLGSYHVNQLSEAGERVIVLARSSSSFDRIQGSDYEVVVADLTDADAVTAAVMKAKPAVIIDASNAPGIRMDDGDSFYWRSIRTLTSAAEAAGVTQVIRHSARGAREILTVLPAVFKDDPRIINYMRDVARAEIALEHSGQTYTIILNSNLPPEPATATGNGMLDADVTIDDGITRADLAAITNTCILNADCYGKRLNGIDPTLTP